MPIVAVQNFIAVTKLLETRAELCDAMDGISIRLGFSYFALAHHDAKWDPRLPSPLALSNYPRSWLKQYFNLHLDRDDPVRLIGRDRLIGFRWGEMHALIDWTREHKAHMAAARRSGLADGFSVPVHAPGGNAGSVSFAVGADRRLPEEHLPLAETVALHAYNAALRLANIGSADAAPSP